MSTGVVVLAFIGLAVGLALALAVVALFNRVVRPTLEIDRYAADIERAGTAIARNVEAVQELTRTRDLANAVPGLATAYLKRIGGELR